MENYSDAVRKTMNMLAAQDPRTSGLQTPTPPITGGTGQAIVTGKDCDRHDHGPEGVCRNGAGIPREKLHASTGRPRGARNLHAKHPSAISKAFRKAGLDWQADFALAIKANNRARIKLWLRLLPYLVTQTNHSTRVKKWKGKASKAALAALDALEARWV
jgi:hypothetical protein